MKVKIITSTHDYWYYARIIYKSIDKSTYSMIIYEISIIFKGIDEKHKNFLLSDIVLKINSLYDSNYVRKDEVDYI